MQRKVANTIQGLQQFPYWGITVDWASTLCKRNHMEEIWDTGFLDHKYQNMK